MASKTEKTDRGEEQRGDTKSDRATEIDLKFSRKQRVVSVAR